MQNKTIEFANEAARVNSELFNKSVEFGVDSAKQIVENISKQSSQWFKIKTVDEYVKLQEAWNRQSIDQTQEVGRKVLALGSEAYSASLNLWEKCARPEQVSENSKES